MLGISPVTAAVLSNRGYDSPQKIKEFLNLSSDTLGDTSLIDDFDKGLEITKSYIESGEKIYIYGDYDADGVTSTVILYRALSELGADVSYYMPHRVYDGYGLNMAAVEKIAEDGCSLLITCDNGIAALDEIDRAKELGMKVVILDHHEPVMRDEKEQLPNGDAVIDCKRSGCRFPFREMCAGGLCYRFAAALFKLMERKFTLNRELVTFAGIATVCDIVPLKYDNRIFVKNALYLINRDIRNIGLSALTAMSVLPGKKITPYILGYNIGPCINAIGRLETAAEAVELFITDDRTKATELAAKLVQANKERRELTQAAEEKIADMIDGSLPVQVLYVPDIHESIAGIAAGHVKDRYFRPTLVITKGSEGCKGSGRSIEGYDLHKNLSQFPQLFTKFGGHAMACGFSLPYENIDKLRKALNDACTLGPEDLTPSLKLDCMIPSDMLTLELAKELETLEPFGCAYEKPHFFTLSIKLSGIKYVGQELNTVKLYFTGKNGTKIQAMFFNGTENTEQFLEEKGNGGLIPKLKRGEYVRTDIEADIAYSIIVGSYNGEYIQLTMDEIR